MRWDVWRRGPRGGGGTKLGQVEAATQAAAVTEAMKQFAKLGLNATNIEVKKPETVY